MLGSSSWISSAALSISSMCKLFPNEEGTYPAIPLAGLPTASDPPRSHRSAALTNRSQLASARDIFWNGQIRFTDVKC